MAHVLLIKVKLALNQFQLVLFRLVPGLHLLHVSLESRATVCPSRTARYVFSNLFRKKWHCSPLNPLQADTCIILYLEGWKDNTAKTKWDQFDKHLHNWHPRTASQVAKGSQHQQI